MSLYFSASFDQGVEIDKAFGTNSKHAGGICWSYALEWVIFHNRNYTDKSTSQAKTRMNKLRELTNSMGFRQDVYGDELAKLAGTPMEYRKKIVEVIGKYTGVAAIDIRQLDNPDKGNIDPIVEYATRVHKYHIYSMRWKDCGHAVASYTSSGGHTYFFDPNTGEDRYSKSSLKKYMVSLMTTYSDEKLGSADLGHVKHLFAIEVQPTVFGRAPATAIPTATGRARSNAVTSR